MTGRPVRDRTMTDAGYTYMEERLRGHCASALRVSNTQANLLSPLLETVGPQDGALFHSVFRDFMGTFSALE